ncbi:hypothetical protein [Inediibacterium massiliense]|uniref:hypothetical protein n=1 Tax=Inediibacterium massiliense TaxID=1658111 RepID=UPI0006B56799|nr:hypothetical protein [Inediibacterium massiliense]
MKIFHLFKRKNQDNHIKNNNDNHNSIDEAKEALENIENILYQEKDKQIFVSLYSFVSYYTFVIEFYKENEEEIMSVQELLFFKYIPMITEIVTAYEEDKTLKKELIHTIEKMNQKLYETINNIKEQKKINLKIDLKTIRDLIQSDF